MTTNAILAAELVTLTYVCKAHKAKIDEASWQRTLAMESSGVPIKGGCYDLPKSEEWRYPSVQEASRQVEILLEDSGYFWACSRVQDIERLIGARSGDQLPLRMADDYVPLYGGHVPHTHPSVTGFLMGSQD